jgi:hypothetical protein
MHFLNGLLIKMPITIFFTARSGIDPDIAEIKNKNIFKNINLSSLYKPLCQGRAGRHGFFYPTDEPILLGGVG